MGVRYFGGRCGFGRFFPGYYYYQARLRDNFVTVKGLAEMDVKADLGIWNIKFVATGNDLQTVQKTCRPIWPLLRII